MRSFPTFFPCIPIFFSRKPTINYQHRNDNILQKLRRHFEIRITAYFQSLDLYLNIFIFFLLMNSKINFIACFCSIWTSCLGWSSFMRSLNDVLLCSFHPHTNLITSVQNDPYAHLGSINLLDHFISSTFSLIFPTLALVSYFFICRQLCTCIYGWIRADEKEYQFLR